MAVSCPKTGCPYVIPEGTDPAVVVALLDGHIKVDHPGPPPTPPSRAYRRREPEPKPKIARGATLKGWQYFLTRWEDYKRTTELQEDEVPAHLLGCMEEQLRREVTTNATGATPLREYTEMNLLKAIKSMAVTRESRRSARVALSRMAQDRGEPIQSFAARLRWQAEVCRFIETCEGCGKKIDSGEHRAADQLCMGLSDPIIQQDLLNLPELENEQTVDEMIDFVNTRVAGRNSFVAINRDQPGVSAIATPPNHPSEGTADEDADQEDALRSGYKRQQQQTHLKATPTRSYKSQAPPRSQGRGKGSSRTPTTLNNSNSKGICEFCGKTGHGTAARTAVRRTQCPAFGTTCSTCGRYNHYHNMCWQASETENDIHETVVSMSEGTIQHQSWDSGTRSWTQKRSPPQPDMDVIVSTHKEDYR